MSPIFSRHPRGELSAYVDAQVTDSRRQAIEGHIESCESCRLETEDLRAIRSTLAALPEVAAPRSFAITAEMAAAPAAAPAANAPPSFAAGLRMASAAIGVALIAVVLVDAGNFSATDSDNDASSGGAERNLVETQAEGDLMATQGADSAAVAESDADQPIEPDAAEDGGNVAGGTSSGASPDTAEGSGDDSADADTAVGTVPEEPVAEGAESAARSAETGREPYGLFPGVPAPPDYVYSAPEPANGGIGGFAPSSGMSSTEEEPGAEATSDEPAAVPEATAAEAPTAANALAPEASTDTDSVSEEVGENTNGDDSTEAPDATGDSALDAAAEDENGGLSTLNVIEIVLAIGLVAAIVGGFVLPRLRHTA